MVLLEATQAQDVVKFCHFSVKHSSFAACGIIHQIIDDEGEALYRLDTALPIEFELDKDDHKFAVGMLVEVKGELCVVDW